MLAKKLFWTVTLRLFLSINFHSPSTRNAKCNDDDDDDEGISWDWDINFHLHSTSIHVLLKFYSYLNFTDNAVLRTFCTVHQSHLPKRNRSWTFSSLFLRTLPYRDKLKISIAMHQKNRNNGHYCDTNRFLSIAWCSSTKILSIATASASIVYYFRIFLSDNDNEKIKREKLEAATMKG